MDNNQPLDLKGPIFKPRPGWGGKLNNWLKNNFESKILPALAIAAIAVGSYAYLDKNTEAQPVVNNGKSETVEKSIQPGQSTTHVVRAIITDYLNKNGFDLSAPQKVYMETYLVSRLERKIYKTGETLSLKTADLDQAIEKAKSLTSQQIQAWSRYVK